MIWLIGKLIEFCVRNRLLVLLLIMGVSGAGVYCLFRTPVDAIPDLSENQVIVEVDWPGRSPHEIESQITYPLTVNLQGLAGVKTIRAESNFGYSMISIIFDEGVDFYFSRQRVLERLSIAGSFLPPGVMPTLAPDATALGQIFWYTVEGEGKSLDELRAIQDWYVRYQLNSVQGVAQVASLGGFVREYQIDVQPEKMRAFDIGLGQVFRAVMASNSSVGGKVIHKGGSEYLVRGVGWAKSLDDFRKVVVAERNGVPITVEQIGMVQFGPAFRRGILEKGGGEAVGGVAMMRFGENPLEVTGRIKEKIQQLEPGLPEGVRIVPFYDRTGLIHASIDTLTHTLVEEIVIASVVILLVLWHLRSAIVICVTLPLSVLISFIFMYLLRIPSNLMSLSGIAISIGVLVDAAVVTVENSYHRLQARFKGGPVTGDTREIVIDACKVVGGPLFFSIVIMLLSFAPIFVLGGMEGKMFNPLAYTKTFALVGVALLAVTLVPALIPWFVRGRLRAQEDVWLVRSFAQIYKPMLEFFLKHPDVIVVLTGLFLIVGLPMFPRKVPWIFFTVAVPFLIGGTATLAARRPWACLGILLVAGIASFRLLKPLGEEFMPPLNELAIMDMATTKPNVNSTLARDVLQLRDATLREFPEVHQVAGKAGRAETPTDPAPLEMFETVVSLKAESWWPKRKLNYSDALAEAREIARRLTSSKPDEGSDLANAAAMDALMRFDREMRGLSMRRLRENSTAKGARLVRTLRDELMRLLQSKKALVRTPSDAEWTGLIETLTARYSDPFDEWILREDVARAADEIVGWLDKKKMLQPLARTPGFFDGFHGKKSEDLITYLKEKGALTKDPPMEKIPETMRPNAMVDALESEGVLARPPDLLTQPPSAWSVLEEPLRAITGRERPTLFERWRELLETKNEELTLERVKALNREIEERGPALFVSLLVDETRQKAKERNLAVLESAVAAVQDERAREFGRWLFFWRKLQSDLVKEMDSELRVPGFSNIWTRPIINRVDMLATGVRTMIGVKVLGEDIDQIQRISDQVAAVLKPIRGAVDVVAEPLVGKNYLEISVKRDKAALYGVDVEDVQDVIEVALGGKQITATIEDRRRFPVRVRYPREWREDEERVGSVLVPVGNGVSKDASSRRLKQIPLSMLADVKIVPGPSMIKSENGRLRNYVTLNVRDRDIVGFVEEAQRAVEAKVKPPPGYSIEWSGQFEHQMHAQRRLMVVFPAVILIIFAILYLTYRDLPDTLMMFLAVPGAVAGGAIFQWLAGFHFSVAVWVGYVACFGLATETGIIMLVYLREAIENRGGLGKITHVGEIRDAVIEGAVHRLRPKLLTEGTMVLALIPMLWATGVGSEFMRPMAAPILGGILVADEVIDILIPVLFFWERCRRWMKLKELNHAETRDMGPGHDDRGDGGVRQEGTASA